MFGILKQRAGFEARKWRTVKSGEVWEVDDGADLGHCYKISWIERGLALLSFVGMELQRFGL